MPLGRVERAGLCATDTVVSMCMAFGTMERNILFFARPDLRQLHIPCAMSSYLILSSPSSLPHLSHQEYLLAPNLSLHQAVLVVNVASFCGFTDSNYRQLQRLYERYADDGLEVLAFPCNQFGAQEPGTQEEISQFLDQNYGITFPVMGKVDVNGEGSEPLFSWLKQASGDVLNIRWNFTKFLVSGGGTTVSRFSHEVDPEDIEVHIRNALSFDEKVDEEVEREL
ncbi:unnamed protein product [Choristocarpus tenellus]